MTSLKQSAETVPHGVLFDYGGVLTTPIIDSANKWIATENIDPQTVRSTLRLWLGRSEPGNILHEFERGHVTQQEFETHFAAKLRHTDGSPVNPENLLAGFFANVHADEPTWQIARDLKTHGHQVALLSNSWGDRYPRALLQTVFSPLIISGEIGLRKPHTDIYQYAAKTINKKPQECVFIDDIPINVTGAEKAGMKGIHHIDAQHTRTALQQLGLLP